MRDNSAILSTAIISTDTTNHDSVRSGTSTTVRAACLDWELQVWSRAAELETFIVLVLMRVAVSSDCLPVGVIVESGCCGVVDGFLGVISAWECQSGSELGCET